MHREHRSQRYGFTLIELLVVIGIIGVLIGLLLPAVQKVREAASRVRCQNNLHQIGLALHSYHDVQGVLPSGYLYKPPPGSSSLSAGKSGPMKIFDWVLPPPSPPPEGPGWSWASLLLPFLDQGNLAKLIQYDLPVGAPIQAQARLTPLSVYTCPSDRAAGVFTVLSDKDVPLGDAYTNSYSSCFGHGGWLGGQPELGNGTFFRNSRVRILDISDGTSTTLAIGERAALFTKAPWAGVITTGTCRTTPGAPVYLSIIQEAPTMALSRIGPHYLNATNSEPYDFFSPHVGGVYFTFGDGSVRFVSESTDVSVLGALATRSGGEVVPGNF